MITVQKWLNSLSGSNLKKRVTYLNGWLRWLKANGGQFSGFDPDGLVEYQKNADNGHKYDLLDLLQSYVTQIKGRKSYKRYVYTLIRSFFLHNRAELPQDRAFRIHADAPKTRTLLTLEDFRKLVLSLDPCNAALYLCMFMSGLGTGEIVYWSNHGAEDLREQLSNDPKIIRIDIPGRKGDRNERNFYSFIAGDALDLLRKWWKIRPRDAKVIFVNGRDTPVTESGVYAIWLRHMRRLGIIDPKKEGQREYSNRTGRGLHELRDLFRTQFTKSQAKREIAEFMMGHIVDPLGYNQVGKDERFCQD
jgi:integrase